MNDIGLPPTDIRYFRERIMNWARQYCGDFPWRVTTNRWHALVAEIMLQRTRAEQVIPIFAAFAERYASPTDYLRDKDACVFHSLGLFWREQYLAQLATILSERDIPDDKESLLKLPGVGEYVASAYLSLHAGRREPIIDSNVVRLYGRFFRFETDGETRRDPEMRHLAELLTPERNFKDYNYGIIDLTRTICKLKPLHEICPLRRRCHTVCVPRGQS
jgi:A/G-specific adenine glycosylase